MLSPKYVDKPQGKFAQQRVSNNQNQPTGKAKYLSIHSKARINNDLNKKNNKILAVKKELEQKKIESLKESKKQFKNNVRRNSVIYNKLYTSIGGAFENGSNTMR